MPSNTIKQLTIYDFGVEEPKDDYSHLFTNKFDILDLPITINHVDELFEDIKDKLQKLGPQKQLELWTNIFGDLNSVDTQDELFDFAESLSNGELAKKTNLLLKFLQEIYKNVV